MGKEELEKSEKREVGRLEGFQYDWKYRQFPQVVEWRGQVYDARDSSKGGSCVYRMTAEWRMRLKEPDFIEVDMEGRVLREWNTGEYSG